MKEDLKEYIGCFFFFGQFPQGTIYHVTLLRNHTRPLFLFNLYSSFCFNFQNVHHFTLRHPGDYEDNNSIALSALFIFIFF